MRFLSFACDNETSTSLVGSLVMRDIGLVDSLVESLVIGLILMITHEFSLQTLEVRPMFEITGAAADFGPPIVASHLPAPDRTTFNHASLIPA